MLVAGGIGIEKGYEVLLACARDAARRRLALSFVVVGHTIDDARLWDTGAVAITGPYAEAEAEALIRGAGAPISASCPRSGRRPGATRSRRCGAPGSMSRCSTSARPAERVRATGRGWVLPLGLAAGAVNNALLGAVASREAWRRAGVPSSAGQWSRTATRIGPERASRPRSAWSLAIAAREVLD